MPELQDVITADRHALAAFVEKAGAISPAQWGTPPASGAWSPGQVTEHVALAYEQSRRMLDGTYTGPVFPWFKQLLARWLFVRPVVRQEHFGKGPFQAPEFLRPSPAPLPSPQLLARLEAAVHDLETDLLQALEAGRATLDHPLFGHLPLVDLLRFQMIHMTHHRAQLSAAV